MSINHQSADVKRKFQDPDEVIDLLSSDESSAAEDPWFRNLNKVYSKKIKKEEQQESNNEKIILKKHEPEQVISNILKKEESEDDDVIFQGETKFIGTKFIDKEFKTIANISYMNLESCTIFKCLICRHETDDEKNFEDHLICHLNDGEIRSGTSFCITCNHQFNAENLIGEFHHLKKYHAVKRITPLAKRILTQNQCSKIGYEETFSKIVQRVESPCSHSQTSTTTLSTEHQMCSTLASCEESENTKNLNNNSDEFDEERFALISEGQINPTISKVVSEKNLHETNLTDNCQISVISEDSLDFLNFTEKETGTQKISYPNYELDLMFTTIKTVNIISNEKIPSECDNEAENDENSANMPNMPELNSDKSSSQPSPSATSDGEGLKIVLTSKNGFKTASVKYTTGLGDPESPKPRREKREYKKRKNSEKKANENLENSEDELNLKSRQKKQKKSSKSSIDAGSSTSTTDSVETNKSLMKKPKNLVEKPKTLIEYPSETTEPALLTKRKSLSSEESASSGDDLSLKRQKGSKTEISSSEVTQKKMSIPKYQKPESSSDSSTAINKILVEKPTTSEPSSLPKLPISTQKVLQSWEAGQMQPLKQYPTKVLKISSPQKINDLISAEKSCLAKEASSSIKTRSTFQETARIAPPSKDFVSAKELMPWMSSKATEFRHNTKSTKIYEKMLSRKCLLDMYKCMDRDCCFTTPDPQVFLKHIADHLRNDGESRSNFLDHCPYCELVLEQTNYFQLAKNVAHHIMDWHQNEIYQCSKCFYRSREPESCFEHFNMKHGKAPKLIFKCSKIQIPDENKFIEGTFQRLKIKKAQISPIACTSE